MSSLVSVSLENRIYTFPGFAPHARAGFTGRDLEASQDLPLFLSCLGAGPEAFCTVDQIHGNRVLVVERPDPLQRPPADALVSREKGIALVIRTADCAPVFLYDPLHQAVGMVHAGWRGTQKKIIKETIETMQNEFGTKPGSLRAAIGPAIRESCYEVGPEFEGYFPGWVRREGSKHFFDLAGAVKKQMEECGVPASSILDSNLCTACSTDRFFSARREGTSTGRLLSATMLK